MATRADDTSLVPLPGEGRDELNIAEFPIATLQRQQPPDSKAKRDTVVFRSTRYDPIRRERVPQTVTVVAPAKFGLPTPADEHVLLALLHLAKLTTNFTKEEVRFVPHQLFQIMHWSGNSRSYQRLRDVLRRLKSLTILYQNAWWDTGQRQFEEEFATALIAEYRLVREGRGRKRTTVPPASWVRWTQSFFESLSRGNLKRLDLRRLFALKLPTTQRLYRFLDKRFYTSPVVTLDLRDLAFGHVGLTPTANVAAVKRNLAPAIVELEAIGFIEPAPPQVRYEKVGRGQWQVTFTRVPAATGEKREGGDGYEHGALSDALVHRGVTSAVANRLVRGHPAEHIRRQLDGFDRLQEARDARASKNPAGFLVRAIRDNFTLELKPPAVPPSSEKGTTSGSEHTRRVPAPEVDRNREAILAYWNALTPVDQNVLEREALATATGAPAEYYRTNPTGPLAQAFRRQVVEDFVRRKLRETEQPPTTKNASRHEPVSPQSERNSEVIDPAAPGSVG